MLPILVALSAWAGEGPLVAEPPSDLVLLEAPPAPTWAGVATPENSAHWDLEELYLAARYAEGLEIAKARSAQQPEDIDLYWHIARFMFEVGEQLGETPTAEKIAFYEEMRDWCDKGLAIDPGHAHVRFGRGIALGRLGTTRGVLASLFLAQDVEQDWLATVDSGMVYATPNGQEVLPCDAYQALGIFYRLVPEWWIVGVIAGTRGDIGKSVEMLEAAHQCAPDVIRNVKELGVSRICYGQRRADPEVLESGMASLRRVLELPARTPTELTDHRHVRALLDDPDLACGYSRDGQQELDQEKLDANGAAGAR